jgi:transcriptional regulator with XRE-family HTH domain
LTRLRKARGITQVQLAELLETTQSLVSKYERGDLLLHGELIVRLSDVLRVSTDELLGVDRKSKKAPPLPVITEKRLLRRVEMLQRLPRREKEALLRTIDAFLAVNEHRHSVA